MTRKVIIMGAAGRDFHNFNMFFKDNKNYQVVAFTQAPGQNIGELAKMPKRSYPKVLAGKLYPKGIPIFPEKYLPQIIRENKADEVVFAYSDVSYIEIMRKASLAISCGADFTLMGPESTMLKSSKFVISVCAVRTGAGKSPTTRKICQMLKAREIKFVVIRHPMPYGDLSKMAVQRFSTKSDLSKYDSTIEEREEYEPLIEAGNVVYAGVDYKEILKQAEKEADVIVWDGGNNDLPFIKPNLHIVVADARRPGHELMYYPGEANLRLADVVIVNKVDTADPAGIDTVIKNVIMINPKAAIIRSAMPVSIDKPELARGKRVLVIEDGPTMTHGGLDYGAGSIIAKSMGSYVVSPREKAVGSIKQVYAEYPYLGAVLPAMGYSKRQIDELEQTINAVECDSVLVGTPVDLRGILSINKPAARIRYEIHEIGKPNLEDVLNKFLKKI
jgi:predicted GTPase